MKNYKRLNVGDTLYKATSMIFSAGILEYKVIEVREQVDNIQYVVECQSCTHHGDKCKVLIAHQSDTTFIFVSQLNNDGYYNEDYDYDLHKDFTSFNKTINGEIYSTTKRETGEFYVRKSISSLEDSIDKMKTEFKTKLEDKQKRIQDLRVWIESLN